MAKVHQLAPPEEIERRYGAINDFEKQLADDGTTVIKCMLHVSAEEQRGRLLARLDDPTKQWKFKPGDVDERGRWGDYRAAYETALERCNTDERAVVRRPERPQVVPQLGDRHSCCSRPCARSDVDWPAPDYDVAEQRARLA